MKIGSIGYNHVHGSDFEMSAPSGFGCWLMLLIRRDSVFEINGSVCDVPAGSFVLISGKTCVTYRAKGKEYADDWLFAAEEDGDAELLASLGIPIDKPVTVGGLDSLSDLVHIMTYEFYSAEKYREELVAHYLLILLMRLSRALSNTTLYDSALYNERNTKLSHLRARMYNAPESITNIDAMAQELGMSRSGFQHLYKKYFGVSASSDIIKGRIEKAKQLLSCTRLSVSEISLRCGYGTCSHFMRQFREVCGKTPSEYRKTL